MKLTILEETCSQLKKSNQCSGCHPGCGSFRKGLDEEDLTKLSHYIYDCKYCCRYSHQYDMLGMFLSSLCIMSHELIIN